ncbi:MAG TPA: hypothetical protein VL098_11080 [Flavipsychrobacter sp.]|nr:hypothetical protein [Flavipsychrobacter sp.]
MKHKVLIGVLSLSAFLSCSKSDKKNSTCGGKDVICTMDFRTITLSVLNVDSTPKQLDSFYSAFSGSDNIILDSKDISAEQLQMMQRYGSYPVISDAQRDKLSSGKNTAVYFVGYQDGIKVMEHSLVVTHDCCHIQLKSENKPVVF